MTELPAKDLPHNYGLNIIWVLVRDPYWIFAYWEIQPAHEDQMLFQAGWKRHQVQSILRVFKTNKLPPSHIDISLNPMARNWYIQVKPNAFYRVEIGFLHPAGDFLSLARSNEVVTPRDGPSEVIDAEWKSCFKNKTQSIFGNPSSFVRPI